MKKSFLKFGFGIVALTALSACGSQALREGAVVSGSVANGTQTGSGTNVSTPTGGNIYNLPAAPQQRLELSGNNSTEFKKTLLVQTGRTLRIKVKPLPAPNVTIPGYTNWVFPYGCLSVSVTVNGMTRSTQTLRVEGVTQGSNSPCANAPTSQIIDFTDQMTGTGQTQIEVSNANYDNCRQYWPLNYGCSMSAIWQNHRVALDATIQVDGTYMD